MSAKRSSRKDVLLSNPSQRPRVKKFKYQVKGCVINWHHLAYSPYVLYLKPSKIRPEDDEPTAEVIRITGRLEGFDFTTKVDRFLNWQTAMAQHDPEAKDVKLLTNLSVFHDPAKLSQALKEVSTVKLVDFDEHYEGSLFRTPSWYRRVCEKLDPYTATLNSSTVTTTAAIAALPKFKAVIEPIIKARDAKGKARAIYSIFD